MSPDKLWIKIQNNDTAAFESLYLLFYQGMCQYASQLLGDRQAAEETVQDIFLKVWDKRSAIYSQNDSIKKYLYRMVHNQCIDTLKRHHTHKESFIKLLSSEAWTTVSEKYGFDGYLIEQLEANDTAARIQQAIDQLPAQCKEIFIKSRIGNQSNEEIATEMHLSENTVRTQIYRAVQKIKEKLYIFLILFCDIL